MSDLAAELRLRFGITKPPTTFALEIDERDANRNQPIKVEEFRVFGWNWSDDQFADFYQGREILKVLENGVQHVRLYAPDRLGADLITTEPPVALKGINNIKFSPHFPTANLVAEEFNRRLFSFEDVTKLPGVSVTEVRPPKPAPPSVEFVGTKNDMVLDVIEFQNQRVAFQKYNYAAGGFETAYASKFVTEDGRFIERPQWVPELNGAFVLKEPASGVIIIRYLVQYHLYRVNYGMASGVEFPQVQLAWLRGDIKTFPLPPVKVLAIAPSAGRVAQASFQKVVYPNGATLSSWSTKAFEEAQENASTLLSERSRTTETIRIEDPDDPSNFLDVQRARSITLYDKDGRPFTYRLNP